MYFLMHYFIFVNHNIRCYLEVLQFFLIKYLMISYWRYFYYYIINVINNKRTNFPNAGSTPYPDMTAREVMRNVQNSYRLERPSHCRSELFRVISRCWQADPDRRPEFQTLRRDLAQLLEDNMNGHYVDLESFASECTDWASSNRDSLEIVSLSFARFCHI